MSFSLSGLAQLSSVKMYTTNMDPTYTSPVLLVTQSPSVTVTFTWPTEDDNVIETHYYWLLVDANAAITNGIVVDKCHFIDIFKPIAGTSAGIRISSNSVGWTITNDHFYQTTDHSGLDTYWAAIGIYSGSGNWNDAMHWSTDTGGGGGASLPTTGYDVIFDSNSFTGAGQIITMPSGTWNCVSIAFQDINPNYSPHFYYKAKLTSIFGNARNLYASKLG